MTKVKRLSQTETSDNKSLKIPITSFKTKELSPQQVVDPNLSPQERVKFQQQIHKENFMTKSLSSSNLHSELNQKFAEEDQKQREEDAKLAEQEFLQMYGIKDIKDLLNKETFTEAFIKTLPLEWQKKIIIKQTSSSPDTTLQDEWRMVRGINKKT